MCLPHCDPFGRHTRGVWSLNKDISIDQFEDLTTTTTTNKQSKKKKKISQRLAVFAHDEEQHADSMHAISEVPLQMRGEEESKFMEHGPS
jgi:hypothetical protein